MASEHQSVKYRKKILPLWLARKLLARPVRLIYKCFEKAFPPQPNWKVLDLGVDGSSEQAYLHFFEFNYPYKENITAAGLEDPALFNTIYPKIEYVKLRRGEPLPFPDASFDMVFCNAVVEHVGNRVRQEEFLNEIFRVGKNAFVTTPNRWYPVEQHGVFWRGHYQFGNIPLVNYLPNTMRNRLAPHVRTYTRGSLFALFQPLSVRFVHHERLFGGYDNIVYRWPKVGRLVRKFLYAAEETPLAALGLSHLLVLQKLS